MSWVLLLGNDGPDLTWTNYFDSDMARRRLVYVTTNAGAFRMLVPAGAGPFRWLPVMADVPELVISRGPWPAAGLADAFELLFDDHTVSPLAIHLGPGAFDRLPAASDEGGTFRFSAWVRNGGRGRIRKVIDRPCLYRRVARLPCLAPWGS
jgi:hypothetical protein